jgi:lipopolysaccharide transport system ATP-binding protein
MPRPIITVEALSKKYEIGAAQEHYRTLGSALSSAARQAAGLLRGERPKTTETFWALKDLNFEVMPGDVVGVIGRNGAGKSTLLKVLSRITTPTEGKIRLRGRIASLLEVGTGFHGELTGRENVFLNGSILGMSRREIERKFDEIVAFAEMDRFIDTPVKRYSSGMYVRLAFAVAAHLEPEILVVDEVLAVGDADFQAKCLGKLEQVGAEGRTVLFVSHNLPMILRLCNRALLLAQGTLVADGPSHEVGARYLYTDSGSPAERHWNAEQGGIGDGVARLRSVRVLDSDNQVTDLLDIRRPVTVEVAYEVKQPRPRVAVTLQCFNDEGTMLFQTSEFNSPDWATKSTEPGGVLARCQIPGNFLAEGRVYVTVALVSYNPDRLHGSDSDCVSFQVVDASDGDAVRGICGRKWPGLVRPMLDWQIGQVPAVTEPRPLVGAAP